MHTLTLKTPITVTLEALQEAARGLGLTLVPVKAQSSAEDRAELNRLYVQRDMILARIELLEKDYFG